MDELTDRTLVRRLHVERLRRAVVVEAFIGVSVLAFTAVLVAQPRGAEALAAKYREPVTASASLGNGKSAEVTVDPGTHGLVNVTVELSDAAQSVTASAVQKAKQIGDSVKPALKKLDVAAPVTTAITTNPNLHGTSIRVDADTNGVKLRGTVKTADQKRIAGEVAQNALKPGQTVENDLTIAGG